MRTPARTFADPEELGRHLAGEIMGLIEAAGGGRLVLGCPAGRSLTTTYRALAALARARDPLPARLEVVMMDEYLDPSPPPRRCDPALPHSCLGYAEREIAGPLRDLLEGGVEVHAPDPAEPEAFDEWLAETGGIDLFLLASGASDGHVAFNPRGSARDSRSRVIELSLITRRDNLATFPHFREVGAVPTHGVSVGIDTIARHSRAAIMVLTGEEKAEAARRILAADGYDPDWPSTVVHACASPRILLDEAAAAAAGQASSITR